MLTRRRCCCGGLAGCHTIGSTAVGFECVNVHDVVTLVDPVVGTITLNWDVGSNNWKATVSYPYPGLGGCPSLTLTMFYTLTSLTGDLIIEWNGFTGTFCPSDAGDYLSVTGNYLGNGGNRISMSSCSSFAATVIVPSALAGVDKIYGAGPTSMSMTSTSATSCCVLMRVTGCNGLALVGADVQVNGVTGTTISQFGQARAVLDVGTAGTYGYSVTSSRVSFSSSRAWTCGDAVTAAATAASGFHCIPGCAWPISDTLLLTWDFADPQLMVRSGSSWDCSFTFDGHDYTVSFDGTTLTMTMDGSDCGATFALDLCYQPGVSDLQISVDPGACGDVGFGVITEA